MKRFAILLLLALCSCAQAKPTLVLQDGIEISKTPAADIRGGSSTAVYPYDNMRPSVVESSADVTARTEAIQGEIDRVAAAGGGIVWLPAGLYQVNQIILKDRVELVGEGIGKTVLLASPDIGSGDALIESDRFDTNKALFDADINTAPFHRNQGSPTRMAVRDMTLDGNGVTLDSPQGIWDVDPEEPNVAKNNDAIRIYGTGTEIDNVKITHFSGDGIHLYQGLLPKSGHTTSADGSNQRIKYAEIRNMGGDGVHIHGFPDGTIDKLWVAECSGTGLIVEGSAWIIHQVHAFGNQYGVTNSGKNRYGEVQVENNTNYGFRTYGDASGTVIERLACFDNCISAGTSYCLIDKPTTIMSTPLSTLQDTNSKTFITLGADAQGTRIKGKIDVDTSAPAGCTVIDMTACLNGRCLIDIYGWGNDADTFTVCKMAAPSLANRINLDYGGMGGTGAKTLDTSDAAVGASNRVVLRHPSGQTATDVYYTGVSSVTPEVELISY